MSLGDRVRVGDFAEIRLREALCARSAFRAAPTARILLGITALARHLLAEAQVWHVL